MAVTGAGIDLREYVQRYGASVRGFQPLRQALRRKGFDSSAGGFPLYDEVPTCAFGGRVNAT